MSNKRKAAQSKGPKTTEALQDRISGLLEWLAEHDPVKAARLIGDYLDELTEELAPKKGSALS